MLVLTRRINEVVMIGENIKIFVLGINGQQIRLGFEAPKDVEIHREEIYDRIQQQRQTNVAEER